MKVRCLKPSKPLRSSSLCCSIKLYGSLSIRLNRSVHLLMIVFLCPQAKIAAKNAAISISCFLEKRCGMQIGSLLIKSGRLYCATFISRKSFSSKNSNVYYLSACSRSAIRSSTSSTPTLRRNKLSVTPTFSRSSLGIEPCVIVVG